MTGRAEGATVHVVIVNWNTGDHLRACLESLSAACGTDGTLRVTVVDNASSDGSADGLDDVGVPLEVIRNDRNTGFAAACNQGARGSTARYLLFLNPDTRVFAETIKAVSGFMDQSETAGIGICGVRLIGDDGRTAVSCARFPTVRVIAGKATGLSQLVPRLLPPHHLRPHELVESRPVDQVIGAFYFVRRGLFERLHGFDERYFIYFEEVDFALRALRTGARSWYLADVAAYHAGNVSSDQIGGARLYHSLRSRLLFARRHCSHASVAAIAVLTLLVEPVARLARGLVRRRPSEVAATARGYAMLIGDLAGRPRP